MRSTLKEKCVIGIEANEAGCQELVEGSFAMATALAPVIGYDAAARSPTKRLPPARAFESWRSSKKCCPKINSTALGSWSMTMPGVEKQK
jgi:aspartate ammonia-lyase